MLQLFTKLCKNTSTSMKNTSKWQTHLPYVHVETFRAHNSLSNTFKRLNQLTTNKQTSSWVTAELVMRMHSSPRPSSERIRQASERPTSHQLTKKLQRSFLGYTAVSRKVVGKTVHSTIPKGNMGYDQCTFPDTVAVESTFVAFF